MKFHDQHDPNPETYFLEAKKMEDGSAFFQIRLKEGPRRWRSEDITISPDDVQRLIKLLSND